MKRLKFCIAPLVLATLLTQPGRAVAFDNYRFSGMAPRPNAPAESQSAAVNLEYRIGDDGIAKVAPANNVFSYPFSGPIGSGSNSVFATLPVKQPSACAPSALDAAKVEQKVRDAATRYGVDADFATAIAWTESRFDPSRRSPKGAIGTMQLMPETAARLYVADICDTAENIDGGVRYLRMLLDRFQNPLVAAAAYNAGEQAIYEHGGVPPYPETVRYVAQVLNRQLGLDTRPIAFRSSSPAPVSDEPDVIGVRSARFVDGVMQFNIKEE